MILRKPYAFLIKYFRIIHILLAFPMLYLIVKTGNIVSFFRDYINAGYYTSITNIASTHINYFMYLSVLGVLIVGIAIYFLMRQKEKSTKFYFFLILFYVILFIMLGVTHSVLASMESSTIEAAAARAYRDIGNIFYLPQFFFVAYTLFRGIGFDIKKFNFELDIKELEITDIDSEEFELNIGIDETKIKRNIRRFIREFRYYVLENKFIFTILCTIFVIIIGTLLYLNRGVYNKTYKQTQLVSHKNLRIQVTNSMITNKDFGGKTFQDNKYYVVLQISLENKGKESTTFDYNNFYLDLKNRRVYPVLDRASYFIDFGRILKEDTELKPDSKNTYILVYEIQENEINDEYTLKILENVTVSVGEIAPNYKKITLKPSNEIKEIDMGATKFGKIATFEESRIGYSSFQIKNYEIKNSYTYNYQNCDTQTKCRELTNIVSSNSNTKTLLILEANYSLDENTFYYKSARTSRLFPNHFITIQYETDLDKKTTYVENITPDTFQKGFILQVSDDLKNAEKINIIITIRNKKYTMVLK